MALLSGSRPAPGCPQYVAKVGTYWIKGSKYYTPDGRIADITTTGFYSSSFYMEYGITDKLTAIVNAPFYVRSTLNEVRLPNGNLVQSGDELNSLGDIDISMKYGWFNNGKIVSAVSLTLGIPSGNPSGGNTMLLQSGDGEFNQLIEGFVSSSFFKGKGFGTATLGYNNRTNGFTNEFRYGIELGYKIKSFWFIMRSYGVKPLESGVDDFVANNGIFSNRIEFLAYSPEILFEITDRIGVSASAGYAVYGKRILASPSYSFGVYLKN